MQDLGGKTPHANGFLMDGADDGNVKIRKIRHQNIVLRLQSREANIGRGLAHLHLTRALHQNVFPNFTIVNVERPPCYLRKFSPDGQHFIAFSSDQTSLEVHKFNGSMAGDHLLQNLSGDNLSEDVRTPEANYIRSHLFKKFFTLTHVINVAPSGEHLNRECSLFTDDCRFVIVGSAAYVSDEPYSYFFDIYQNNESVTPNPRSPLEDYSLHLVDMLTGVRCDTRTFKCDKIFLSHNQGLYLYKNILAVLSVQHQTVHIFHVVPSGRFVDVRSVGRFCHEDDNLLISTIRHENEINPAVVFRAFKERSINLLKHRLLVYLWQLAECDGTQTSKSHFFKYFQQVMKLRMWKMQLLDEEHLLVKYASEDVVTLRVQDPNSQDSFFVIYNMITTNVIAVYDNTSEEFLELFENFCDMFRNATLHFQTQFTCSASTNIYARQIQQRFKSTIINAKYGGRTEAIRRLLAQLPISAQSYSSSPYLDLSIFSYDDKWVSVMERPKSCGDHPIRFYARDSGLLRFKVHAGLMVNTTMLSRKLVAFTFHPSEPFAISVQRTNADYVVNFHVRHTSNIS